MMMFALLDPMLPIPASCCHYDYILFLPDIFDDTMQYASFFLFFRMCCLLPFRSNMQCFLLLVSICLMSVCLCL